MSEVWEKLFNISKKIAEGVITEEEVKEFQEMVTCFEYGGYSPYINLTALSLSKIKIKATDKKLKILLSFFFRCLKKLLLLI